MNKSKHIFWQKQLANWSVSGLSQKAYCSQEGLKISTFSCWRKRLRAPKDSCGKLIRVPFSPYGASVRVIISGLQLDVPVNALEQVLPIILRSQQEVAGC